MTRAQQLAVLSLVVTQLALVSIGCATRGNEADFPAPIATSGVGPFRAARVVETGFTEPPAGRVMESTWAVERAQLTDIGLFFAAGIPLEDAPDRDPALAADVTDWSRYGPRQIYQTAARDQDLGFDLEAATPVLEATEPWEEGAVSDPWFDVDSGRLYYAAGGSIGMVEAGEGGAFGPHQQVLAVPEAGLRSPTVVRDPVGDGVLLYVQTRAGVAVARSEDGVAFTFDRNLSLDLPTEAVDPDATEERWSGPGALVATSPTGRTTVRLYFSVLRSDGTRVIGMAASEDGLRFERSPTPAFIGDLPRSPCPFLESFNGVDVTRIYSTAEFARSDFAFRAVTAHISPLDVMYAEEEEEPAE